MNKVIIAISIIIIMISLGLSYVAIKNRDNKNAKVTSSVTSDDSKYVLDGVWTPVPGQHLTFNSKIFQKKNKTNVLVPIKFDGGYKTSWISFIGVPSTDPKEYLMTHPKLLGIAWDRIDESALKLYQKNKIYNSIEDLLKNPPDKAKILVDNAVGDLARFANLSVTRLAEDTNLDDYDFLITTYKPIQVQDDYYIYTNQIDAESAKLSGEEIVWNIIVPTASDQQPYYVNQIHVDYQQY